MKDRPERHVRRNARRLACVLGLTVLLWSGREMAERFVTFRKPYVMGGLQVELDDRVLYRIVPDPRSGINSWGYRDREPAPLKKRPRLLVLGDSYIMGLNVPADRTLPRALEGALGGRLEVLDLGVMGYGPDQSYVRLLQDGPGLHPDALVLSLFPANDFADLAKNRIFRLDAAGRLAWSPENAVTSALADRRLSFQLWKALTGRPVARRVDYDLFQVLFVDTYDPLTPGTPESRRKILLMRGVLARFQKLADLSGLPLSILIIPAFAAPGVLPPGQPPADRFLNDTRAEEICSQLGIPFLSLVVPFTESGRRDLYDPRDGHLSIEGNRFAADLLAAFLARRGALTRSSRKDLPLMNVFP